MICWLLRQIYWCFESNWRIFLSSIWCLWHMIWFCWMSLIFSFVFLPKSKLYLLKFVPDFAASLYLTPAQVRLLLTEATFLRPPWWGLTYWKQKESLHLNHPVSYLHIFHIIFFMRSHFLTDEGWQGFAGFRRTESLSPWGERVFDIHL